MSTPLRIVLRFIPAALVLLSACSTEQPAPVATLGADATASPAITAAPTETPATPEPTTTPEPTIAGPVEQNVNWSIPFTITTPADWERDAELPATPTTFQYAVGLDRWVIWHRPQADSVEAYVETLRGRESFLATDAEVTEVGGAPGVVFDIDVTEEAGEVTLFRESWGDWVVEAGRPSRVWVVAVGGQPIMITTDAPAGAFDNWIAVVEDALATLEWSE